MNLSPIPNKKLLVLDTKHDSSRREWHVDIAGPRGLRVSSAARLGRSRTFSLGEQFGHSVRISGHKEISVWYKDEREAHEGGKRILMADSCCTAETNTTL